jgi:hypothetical protein
VAATPSNKLEPSTPRNVFEDNPKVALNKPSAHHGGVMGAPLSRQPSAPVFMQHHIEKVMAGMDVGKPNNNAASKKFVEE